MIWACYRASTLCQLGFGFRLGSGKGWGVEGGLGLYRARVILGIGLRLGLGVVHDTSALLCWHLSHDTITLTQWERSDTYISINFVVIKVPILLMGYHYC